MNVVDSSAWLSYFAGEKNAGYFAAAIEDAELLIVPSICLYEVFKVVLREKGKDAALSVAASMQLGRVVDLDANLALEAATVGIEKGLALADSIIYAVAKLNDAVLWTQDAHFAGMRNVRYRKKP
jgi:predicted nucleic acid-binding protein